MSLFNPAAFFFPFGIERPQVVHVCSSVVLILYELKWT